MFRGSNASESESAAMPPVRPGFGVEPKGEAAAAPPFLRFIPRLLPQPMLTRLAEAWHGKGTSSRDPPGYTRLAGLPLKGHTTTHCQHPADSPRHAAGWGQKLAKPAEAALQLSGPTPLQAWENRLALVEIRGHSRFPSST